MRHKLVVSVFVRKDPYLSERAPNTAVKIGKVSRDLTKLALSKCNTTLIYLLATQRKKALGVYKQLSRAARVS